MEYRDFDLRIGRLDGGYQALVQTSPVGEAGPIEFASPCTEAELADLRQQLELASGEDGVSLARDFGVRLFSTLFQGALEQCLLRSIDEIRRDRARLRIRLRLSGVPELAELPWEFLYYRGRDRDQFLALSDEISVVRYPDRAEAFPSLPVEPPLRVLVVLASPSDAPQLDTEREWQLVESAIRPLTETGRVELERCPAGTFQSLVETLRKNAYHALHFIGHGVFSSAGAGQLVFENEEGRAQLIDGQMLAWMLMNHPSMRLVLLNACEGGRGDRSDALKGVAQRLVQTGIPAVIAMQFSISEDAATAFSTTLYGSIAEGTPLDAALTIARTQMFAVGSQLEWATPVLYMRASDTRLFDITPTTEAERKQFELQLLDRRAQAAVAAEDWLAAIGTLESILRQAPEFEGAQARLQVALRQKQLAELFATGQEHYDAERWSQALDYFRQVSKLAGSNYKGVWTFMSTAQSKLQKVQVEDAPPPPGDEASRAEPDRDDRHYDDLQEKILGGRLVFVLGDDVNLCSRPAGRAWKYGESEYIPSNSDVAAHLAQLVAYPRQARSDLGAVSQFYAFKEGTGALRERLHSIFAGDYAPTALHQLLAGLPRILRARAAPARLPLIVTTNYDDSLEQAFLQAGEQFDLVSYVAAGDGSPGRFVHHLPDGEAREIDKPNEYTLVALEQRTVILRVHGVIDRADAVNDSYVVAEDDYIDYASGQDIAGLLPVKLLMKLRRSHVLFLGYNPQYWSHRVFFRRVWADQAFTNYKSWAVSPDPQELDVHFWQRRAVEVINLSLDAYTARLGARLETLIASEASV